MPSCFLNNAHLLHLKQKQRSEFGRAQSSNLNLGSDQTRGKPTAAASKLQEEHRLIYPEGRPLPPLQGTVKPLLRSGNQSEDLSDSDDESSNGMGVGDRMVVRASKDGSKVTLKKTEWEKFEADYKKKRDQNTILVGEVAAQKKRLAQKDGLIAKLEEKIRELKSKRKGKKANRSDEQKDDVKIAVKAYIKIVLFRTVKFAQPGKELQTATIQVWDGIKGDMKLEEGPHPITKDDFVDIYDSYVLTVLSEKRQYIQTRTMEASHEWWEDHKNLPTLKEIENVWKLPEAPSQDSPQEVKDKYSHAVTVLTWYLDKFLPMAAGQEYWGPHIRPFHLMTDKVDVEGDVSGKKKVLVTVTSEAFGILVYANCRDKWIADFTLKDGDRKAKIPKYDKDNKETHKHQNKWSSSRTGQIQGGGWSKEALKYFNTLIEKIKNFRIEEEEAGNLRFEYGKQLIRVANSVETGNESDSSSGKKRKRSGGKPEDEIETVDISFLDE